MADLEEPILPTAAANAGHTFMNAFYMATQVAGKRRQLEEQIRKMDMQMGLNEQKFDLQQKVDAQNYGLKLDAQNRAYERLAMDSDYKNRTENLRELIAEQKWGEGKRLLDQGADYSDEVAALNEKSQKGTADWDNGYDAISHKFQGFLQTPQGQRLHRNNMQGGKQAAMQMNKDLADTKKRLQNTLDLGSRTPGHPWTIPDVGLDSKFHIPSTDSDGNKTTTIAEYPDPNQTGMWKQLTKDELSKPGATYPKLRYRTINTNALESAKPLHEKYSGVTSGDPKNRPAHVYNDVNPEIQHARDAIQNGAPRDKVIERLQKRGFDPSDL